MTEEELNELVEIAKKACLSPAPAIGYRFELLELYLSALFTLENFSQEEKEKFATQFKGLSDEDRQRLLTRLANKSHPSSFHLSHDDVRKLEAARKELTFNDRARLSGAFISTTAGTAWLDLGEVSNAIVSIDDRSTPERETRPYAHIYFTDDYRRRVETIDIIESVKQDPTAIGHPAVAFAIYHWQQVIYMERVIERDDVTTKDEAGRYFKDEHRGGRDLRSAKNCLSAISPALCEYAEGRSIPMESALALRMQWCGLLQDPVRDSQRNGEDGDGGEKECGGTVVYKAWEMLRAESIAKLFSKSDEISKRSDSEEILKNLGLELDAYERTMERYVQPIYAHSVTEFLRDTGEKGGSRFVGLNADGSSPSQRWIVFRNAFAAWYFDLAQSGTVATYLRRAKRQNIVIDNEGKIIPRETYRPSVLYPKASLAWILTRLLTRPMVAVRKPVWLGEGRIRFDDIEDAIRQSSNAD